MEVISFTKSIEKTTISVYNIIVGGQHDDNKNLYSPYFADNLNTPDNVCKNTHTKLFKSQFSGASGNNTAQTNTTENIYVFGGVSALFHSISFQQYKNQRQYKHKSSTDNCCPFTYKDCFGVRTDICVIQIC